MWAWGEAVKGRVTRCGGGRGMGSVVSAWPHLAGLPHPGLALFVTWTPAPVCSASPCCHTGLSQSFPTQPGSQRGLKKPHISSRPWAPCRVSFWAWRQPGMLCLLPPAPSHGASPFSVPYTCSFLLAAQMVHAICSGTSLTSSPNGCLSPFSRSHP